jgi:hypothetical protein
VLTLFHTVLRLFRCGAFVKTIRQRTKFLLALLVISGGLTCAALLTIGYIVQHRERASIQKDLRNLASVYQQFEQQREFAPTRSAEVLANLPSVRAMMTTGDPKTIQDASADVWRLCGCDFLLLSNSTGTMLALQPNSIGFDRGMAQVLLRQSIEREESRDWWFGSGHLYEVWIQPIYVGELSPDQKALGLMAVGREIDARAAKEFSLLMSAEVAFQCGDTIAASTLPDAQQKELRHYLSIGSKIPAGVPEEIELGSARYFLAALDLKPASRPPVFLLVLRSIDGTSLSVRNVNRIFLGLGLTFILAGSIVLFLVADTFTPRFASALTAVRKARSWQRARSRRL